MTKGSRHSIKVKSYLHQFYEAKATPSAAGRSGAADGASGGIEGERLRLLRAPHPPHEQSKSLEQSAGSEAKGWHWGPVCCPIVILCTGVGLVLLGAGCFSVEIAAKAQHLGVLRLLSVGLVGIGCLLACAGTAASLLMPRPGAVAASGISETDVETAGKSVEEE